MRVIAVFLSILSLSLFGIERPLDRNTRLTLPLSTEGVNMLEVSGDRIVKLVFQGSTLQLEGEPRDGRLFISPKMPKNATVFATLFTEKGHIQPLSFVIQDESAPVSLRLTARRSFSEKKKSTRKKDSYGSYNERRVLGLLKDTIEGRLIGHKTHGFCKGKALSFDSVSVFKKGQLTVTRIEGLSTVESSVLTSCFKTILAKTKENNSLYIVSGAL